MLNSVRTQRKKIKESKNALKIDLGEARQEYSELTIQKYKFDSLRKVKVIQNLMRLISKYIACSLFFEAFKTFEQIKELYMSFDQELRETKVLSHLADQLEDLQEDIVQLCLAHLVNHLFLYGIDSTGFDAVLQEESQDLKLGSNRLMQRLEDKEMNDNDISNRKVQKEQTEAFLDKISFFMNLPKIVQTFEEDPLTGFRKGLIQNYIQTLIRQEGVLNWRVEFQNYKSFGQQNLGMNNFNFILSLLTMNQLHKQDRIYEIFAANLEEKTNRYLLVVLRAVMYGLKSNKRAKVQIKNPPL